MTVHHDELILTSRGEGEIHDLTEQVAGIVHRSGIADGIVTVPYQRRTVRRVTRVSCSLCIRTRYPPFATARPEASRPSQVN